MASMPFKNVCVVVDGSDASIAATNLAVEVAKASMANLTAVAVIDTETLKMLLTSNILVDEEVKELEEDLAASNGRYLERAVQTARKAGQRIETVLLRGSFHSSILTEAHKRNFDLIVIGFSPLGSTRRDLMSHERELILNNVTSPVLLVKASKAP